MTAMRVLLDGYWWHEGPPSNAMVQRELVRAWARRFPQDELVLVVPSAHVELVRAARSVPEGVRLVGVRARPHGVAVMTAYPALARRVGADVVVSHNFVALGKPSVVFLHDVLFQERPEWFTRRERVYLRPVTGLLGRASAVVTSSAHEAHRIERLNGKVRGVRPVGLAPDPALYAIEPHRPSNLGPAVEGFVLSVGRLNVRKNLATTIAAAMQSGTVTREHPLVVVGERDGRAPALDAPARAAIDAGVVVLLGHVPDAELAWLYRHATVFVFLSLDEGYGLPPVEALAFGTPVVASDIGVFRETVGAYATLVDPTDVAGAAAAIAQLGGPAVQAAIRLPDWDGPVDGLHAAAETAVARQRVR
ncbi:glycosyltransferase family 4 protein [Cellulomonas rhizosphaerae]|uniref:Glycosyltransferase family 1 protein n=1 Tax=Cellulomonas rhizosphaerae TaxID=2293719 RepID=A0A413RNG8_9CELL|nr:glycosyltransferase family 1 protein [Cellulomonas rhizosphaerae]RHA43144.1 glycosyltransferase family 1 protein [Cellulomonas rhizosphaerae]